MHDEGAHEREARYADGDVRGVPAAGIRGAAHEGDAFNGSAVRAGESRGPGPERVPDHRVDAPFPPRQETEELHELQRARPASLAVPVGGRVPGEGREARRDERLDERRELPAVAGPPVGEEDDRAAAPSPQRDAAAGELHPLAAGAPDVSLGIPLATLADGEVKGHGPGLQRNHGLRFSAHESGLRRLQSADVRRWSQRRSSRRCRGGAGVLRRHARCAQPSGA